MRRTVVAGLLLAASAAGAEVPAVTPGDFADELKGKAALVVLDVRSPEEFAGGRVPGAINVPVQRLEQQLGRVPREREIVVYCERGPRAEKAAGLLESHGYRKVRVLDGSMSAWRAAGLPVER